MHRGLGSAVVELRSRMHWGQVDLANQIAKSGSGRSVMAAPGQGSISRWENGVQAPSPVYRAALARIAAEHKHDDLVETFRAPTSAWRLVANGNKLAGDDK